MTDAEIAALTKSCTDAVSSVTDKLQTEHVTFSAFHALFMHRLLAAAAMGNTPSGGAMRHTT